jgi:RNA polymerase sigma-70 factor (ECF subfamily)
MPALTWPSSGITARPSSHFEWESAVDLLRRRSAEQIEVAGIMADEEQATRREGPGYGEETRSDEELMLAFRHGEAPAFEVLVVRHKRTLYNFLLRSVHDRSRADELLQEVFLRIVRAKDRYETSAKFTTWVFTIARNLCVDESRRQKFRKTLPLEAKRRGKGEDSGLSVLDTTAAKQIATDAGSEAPTIRERIADAIERLPDDQRQVFLMRQFGGLSFKQIGEAVDAPENTVKSRMRYALEKLRSELQDIDPRELAEASQPRKASGG